MDNEKLNQRLVQIEPLKRNNLANTTNEVQTPLLSDVDIYYRKAVLGYRRILGFFHSTHSIYSTRRWIYAQILPDNVLNRWKPYLKGECNRCGACCKIVFTCNFYVEQDNASSCAIYINPKHAPTACVEFPFDPKDLEDVKRNIAPVECPFYFEGEPDYPTTWGAYKAEMRTRIVKRVDKFKEVFLI